MLRRFICGVALLLITLVAAPAFAQLNGQNLLGDTGVKNGSQAAPGFYAGFLFYRYSTDTIKNKDGERLTIDPGQAGSQSLNAFMPVFVYVSPKKVLGGNYGMMAVVPSANAALEAPGLGFQAEIDTGWADTYIMPFQLGWHTPRADVLTSFAFVAPTGRYEAGGNDNIGKGMWSYEVSAGTTLYLDRQKSLSVSTAAFWETHTEKSGSGDVSVGNVTLPGVRVGQLLTLEGGVGKSFLGGAASVGLAYYAQWKVTDDEFGLPINLPDGPVIGKHRVWAVGPDVTVPLATKTKLIALVNVRYLWEAGARVKTEGQSLVITATLPVPSIKLPPGN